MAVAIHLIVLHLHTRCLTIIRLEPPVSKVLPMSLDDHNPEGYYKGEDEGHIGVARAFEKLTSKSNLDRALDACPKIRVLMVGGAGVGKTTALNVIFPQTVKTNPAGSEIRGTHDIDTSYTSDDRLYNRYIIHDSQGLQAGTGNELKTAVDFVKKRNAMSDIQENVHAIWSVTR